MPADIIEANEELLGPIFYRFLYKLHVSQFTYSANDSVMLFLSRGGIRIRHYYETFLKANNLHASLQYTDFYISRMAIIKASLLSNYETVYEDFLREYGWFTVEETIRAFFGNNHFDSWSRKAVGFDTKQRIDSDVLNLLLWSNTDAADYLRALLHEQEQMYKLYLDQKMGQKKKVILVDTGWSGSILNYMQSFDKSREYTALFFGRYNYGNDDLPWFNRVIGVEVEDKEFNKRNPVSAFFLNRHLVEGLCEIRWQSVEGYERTGITDSLRSIVEPSSGIAPEEKVSPDDSELQACGVLAYVCKAADKVDITLIHSRAEKAAKRLKNLLMYPGKNSVQAFSVPTRSADFGKDLDVPFFVARENNLLNVKKKLKNIHNSMWPAGQIYNEFPVIHVIVQYLYHNRMRILQVLRKFKVAI